nr:MarR family transcriptional regulator [Saccharopolyspora sp. HNM0983]
MVLSRLEVAGPMTLKELAQAYRLDLSTINRQVAPLVRQGLIERFADPGGGAARKLRPTELGRQELAHDREGVCAALAEVTEGWSPERLAQFRDLVGEFNRTVEEKERDRHRQD